MGDSHVGLQARLMSQALRKLTGVIGKTNTVCIFINQLREKVGIVYGNPEVTTGGRALKYYSSVRIDVRRIEGLKDSTGAFIGNRTRAKIVKNKVAPPFREAEFDIMFGEGISKIGEILDLGVKLGVVQKSGAWFNYGEMRLGQGRDNAKQFLKDHPEVSDEIEKIVRANSDRLLAAGKKGTVKPLDPSEVIKPAAAAEAPAVWRCFWTASLPSRWMRTPSPLPPCTRMTSWRTGRSRSCARKARPAARWTRPWIIYPCATTRQGSCTRSSAGSSTPTALPTPWRGRGSWGF